MWAELTTFLQGLLSNSDIILSSPPRDWTVRTRTDQQTHISSPFQSLSCSAVGSTSSLVLVSWHPHRLVMSRVVPSQPGAAPSALFTLLPSTRSNCSSPAGPSYWQSNACRELVLQTFLFGNGNSSLWNMFLGEFFIGLFCLFANWKISYSIFNCLLFLVTSFVGINNDICGFFNYRLLSSCFMALWHSSIYLQWPEVTKWLNESCSRYSNRWCCFSPSQLSYCSRCNI